jgi:hypothetical protein
LSPISLLQRRSACRELSAMPRTSYGAATVVAFNLTLVALVLSALPASGQGAAPGTLADPSCQLRASLWLSHSSCLAALSSVRWWVGCVQLLGCERQEVEVSPPWRLCIATLQAWLHAGRC